MQDMFGELAVEAYVDSQTLFNVVAKDVATKESRLQIGILAHRIGGIIWGNNVADVLTNPVLSTQ